MDSDTKQIIEESAAASFAGTRDFPAHVAAIAACGIESYRVDFRQHASTYFLPSGEFHTVEMPAHGGTIAGAFDEGAIAGAIRAIQRGQIQYPEFVDRILRAGCVGYVVWIAGHHASYFGRRGEVLDERFPPARTGRAGSTTRPAAK